MVHETGNAKCIRVQGIELKKPDFLQLKCERPLLDPRELARIKEDAEIEAWRRNAPTLGGSE